MGHKTSDGWQFDENNHWRVCSVCEEVLAETQMSHEMNGEKCTSCSFDSTAPKTDAPAPDGDGEGGTAMTWLWLLPVVLAVAAVSIPIAVLLCKKKKV